MPNYLKVNGSKWRVPHNAFRLSSILSADGLTVHVRTKQKTTCIFLSRLLWCWSVVTRVSRSHVHFCASSSSSRTHLYYYNYIYFSVVQDPYAHAVECSRAGSMRRRVCVAHLQFAKARAQAQDLWVSLSATHCSECFAHMHACVACCTNRARRPAGITRPLKMCEFLYVCVCGGSFWRFQLLLYVRACASVVCAFWWWAIWRRTRRDARARILMRRCDLFSVQCLRILSVVSEAICPTAPNCFCFGFCLLSVCLDGSVFYIRLCDHWLRLYTQESNIYSSNQVKKAI